MKHTIEIDDSNEAFKTNTTYEELTQILENLCKKLKAANEDDIEVKNLKLRDSNGNEVGFYKVSITRNREEKLEIKNEPKATKAR